MDNGESSYRRFLLGDDEGIVEIIRDYKDGLLLYILGMTNNFSDAEDYMEDTFVRLATKKPRFSGKSSFKTWLYAIARNVTIDGMRRSASRHRGEVSEISPSMKSDEEALETRLIRDENKIMLRRALCKLSSDYSQALYLVYFEDLSYEDAARVMRKSKKQMSNLVYRTKLSLKAELEKEGFVYENL
ncbi:MAG: RNA polymerase sigma factor [Firmicutes bacterium]|nr:RNA polymerase sigma factor [Bacillota bacterium]